MKWNEQLRQERESRGWAQGWMAKEIGTTTDTVNRWENGKTFPSPFYRQQLSQLFGKSLEELGLFSSHSANVKSRSNGSKSASNEEHVYSNYNTRNPLLTAVEDANDDVHIFAEGECKSSEETGLASEEEHVRGLSAIRPFHQFVLFLSTILLTILIIVALLSAFNRPLLPTSPPSTLQESIDNIVQGTGINQFNYIGNGWQHSTHNQNSTCGFTPILNNSTISSDNTANDYVTLTFTGVQLEFYGMVAPSYGIGAVSLDGSSESMIDFYAATPESNRLLWTSAKLSPGTHTFKLRVTDNKNPRSFEAYIAVGRVNITHYVL